MSSQRNSAAQAISLITESVKLLKWLSSFKDQSFNSCILCVHTGVHVRSTCVHQQMQLYYEKLQKNYCFFQIFSEMWFVFRLHLLLGYGLSTTHQRLLQNERVTQIREVLLMLVRTGTQCCKGGWAWGLQPSEGEIHIKIKCKGSHLGTVSQKYIMTQQVKRKLESWWWVMGYWYTLSFKNLSVIYNKTEESFPVKSEELWHLWPGASWALTWKAAPSLG